MLPAFIVHHEMHRQAFDVVYSSVILAGMLALAKHRWWRLAALAFGVPTIAVTWIANVQGDAATPAVLAIGYLFGSLFLLLAAAMIIRRLFRAESISTDSLCGAVCGYLVIGLAFALGYCALELVSPRSFQVDGTWAEEFRHTFARPSVLIYYSFTTMTTLGYGDVTPGTPPARTLSWCEAATGQFYIAMIVAELVAVKVAGGRRGGMK